MAHKGYYKIINKHKYIGDWSNIIFRSSWEQKFMYYCDTNPNIIKWASEEIHIPYISPIDNRVHKYYPDFFMEVRQHNNNIQKMLIEIKPKKQTRAPKNNKNKKQYIYEYKAWTVNEAKWKATLKFCEAKNWQFKILTEKSLF